MLVLSAYNETIPADVIEMAEATRAPVAHGAGVEPAVHRLGQRLAAERAVALALLQSVCLHLLHHLKGLWQAFHRCRLLWHRGVPSDGCRKPQGVPPPD